MSAEQPLHAAVRLLITERSENSAQELDSMLRNAGIATRLRVTDLADAADHLPTADLMLCNADLPRLDALLPALRAAAPLLPIILVNRSQTGLSTAAGMRLGATDVVSADDHEALVLVFRRELAHVCQAQRLREAQSALAETEERCRLLLGGARAAIAYIHEGMHIHANPRYLAMFGFADPNALVGVPLIDLLCPDSAEALKQSLKRLRIDGIDQTLEFRGFATSGESVAGIMTLQMAQHDGEPCLQVTVRGTTCRGALPEAVASEAKSAADGLDGFLAALPPWLDGEGACRALLVAQIDRFPKLQQVLGLRAAEAIANRSYRVMKDHLGGRPCVRLNPHQLAFAMAATDRAHLVEQAESLRRIVEAATGAGEGDAVGVTLSIGGAELGRAQPEVGDAWFEKALEGAFAAAARVEGDGGGRVDVITGTAAPDIPDGEAGGLLARINHAIDNNRFVLLFQPIISLRGESDEHYEAFLRMLDANDRHMAPKDFLHTAVDHGIAGKIDRWVILQSIQLLSSRRSRGHNTRMTITVTANSVSDPDFLPWLGLAVKAARLPSDAFIFQVTEQDAEAHLRETRAFFLDLRSMHYRGSLSRFGLSDNPMELLQHLPVDYVKLDCANLDGITDDPKRREAVTSTIRALQDNGRLTVIPMVERAGTLSILWQAGANFIQGHYLQEPSAEMDFDFGSDD
jgi:multidomain signaling protein FimX